MSYCVNCGVELAAGTKDCPLCRTEVLNPREGDAVQPEQMYPSHIEQMNDWKIDRRGIALIASIFLLIPALVTVAANVVIGGRLSWSLIVVDSLFLIFMWAVIPFFGKEYHPSRHMAAGFASTLIFLYVIEWLTSGSWFWRLGAPIVGAAAILVIGLYFVFTRKRPPALIRIALVLFASGLFNVAVEFLVNRFIGRPLISSSWAIYAIIPCVLLGVAAIILEGRKDLKEQLRKRLFF